MEVVAVASPLQAVLQQEDANQWQVDMAGGELCKGDQYAQRENPAMSLSPSQSVGSELSDDSLLCVGVEESVCDSRQFVRTLSKSLLRLAQRAAFDEGSARVPFAAQAIPKLSLNKYLNRIVGYLDEVEDFSTWQVDGSGAKVSPGLASLVVCCIYIDRVFACNPTFQITPHNIHRLMLTGIVVGTKTW
eukprot:CAMPEP_0203765694 /NCGR_PEP_ID=MMETSP0099_2-20121227/8_1 /ASSEMBLY_ACC=CAM_ASM_000209 /TAXON_ID=96639 /ORGANISM=" , Strain NY0313808BC1" /LENGTH=188 /DNA_ID=CAMNT_0050661969 /DNA_START=176 /DNA_END=739 /DNA_ORIENTATION=+